jgi:hypothetical protein
MNLIYRLFLTFNATLWVAVIYGIKEDWTIVSLPTWLFAVLLLLVPIILSAVSIPMTLKLSKDDLKTCGKLEEANSSFLPVYLGYFFVGLGIDKLQHMIIIYLVIFIFTYVAQAQYFNPMYLLFGYRYYHAETEQGTKVFLIVRKNLRKAKDAEFGHLRRINDTTYIAWRER